MAVRRLLPALALAAAVVAASPASASAAAWPARTVATGGPAFHRDVVGLPNGTVGTLLERRVGREARLELWAGTRRTVVVRSAAGHTFDAKLGADAAGHFVVAWDAVPDSGGARQAYAWTVAGGIQPLTSGTQSVTTVDLAVAANGRAVVAAASASGRTVTVARGTADAGFGAPVADVSGGHGDFPAFAGIARDGTATVAWEAEGRRGIALARAAWGAAFGALATVAVPHLDELAFAVAGDGRAVVAAKQTERQLSGSYTRDVATFTWAPGAAAPSAPVVVSQGQAGVPAAAAVGDRAFVVWRQARTTTTAPSALGVAVFDGGATPHVRVTVPGHGGAGSPLGPLALAPSGTGVRPYFAVGDAIHTTHADASGRVSGTAIAVAAAGGRPVAVWTRQVLPGNAGYRVRIARPRP